MHYQIHDFLTYFLMKPMSSKFNPSPFLHKAIQKEPEDSEKKICVAGGFKSGVKG